MLLLELSYALASLHDTVAICPSMQYLQSAQVYAISACLQTANLLGPVAPNLRFFPDNNGMCTVSQKSRRNSIQFAPRTNSSRSK